MCVERKKKKYKKKKSDDITEKLVKNVKRVGLKMEAEGKCEGEEIKRMYVGWWILVEFRRFFW